MTSASIDITCDMGESFGIYKLGRDEDVMPYVTSANVGCGFHGGDPTVMRHTVRLAKQHGVAIGAHFGYYDLRGFGRRWITMDKADLINDIIYQMGALQAICHAEGAEITHVKPHGALDDMAALDATIAGAIVEAVGHLRSDAADLHRVERRDPKARSGGGDPHRAAGLRRPRVTDQGVEIAGYRLECVGGSTEAAIQRIMSAVTSGQLASEHGVLLDWQADSVCFHGDGTDALIYATALPAALRGAGLSIKAPYARAA